MVAIDPFDKGRYFISIDGSEEYLVDIEELDGNGQCGCQDFQYRMLPFLQREIDTLGHIGKTRQCKHILVALAQLGSVKSNTDAPTSHKEVREGEGEQHDQKGKHWRPRVDSIKQRIRTMPAQSPGGTPIPSGTNQTDNKKGGAR
jgi:hypothetical protein